MQELTKSTELWSKGFTLIEMMVVTVVISIFVALGLPGMRAFVAGGRLVTQTNDVISALQVARSEAIRLNTPVTFCRVANNTATTCLGGSGGEDWKFWAILAPALPQPVLRRGEISAANINVKVSSQLASRVSGDDTNNAVTFDSDSLARRTDGRVLVSGNLRVCSTDDSLTSNFRLIQIVGGGRVFLNKESSTGRSTCMNSVTD